MLTISWLGDAAVERRVMMGIGFMNLWLGWVISMRLCCQFVDHYRDNSIILSINDAFIIDITIKLNRKVLIGGCLFY